MTHIPLGDLDDEKSVCLADVLGRQEVDRTHVSRRPELYFLKHDHAALARFGCKEFAPRNCRHDCTTISRREPMMISMITIVVALTPFKSPHSPVVAHGVQRNCLLTGRCKAVGGQLMLFQELSCEVLWRCAGGLCELVMTRLISAVEPGVLVCWKYQVPHPIVPRSRL